ncbi:sensor histidine kinase [Herbaspirillum seropedicae]|uniref:sensor histidine kinase n=1 Tax=Herbaspirillum seropedicae TaxID=964 RepID=UPI003D98676E
MPKIKDRVIDIARRYQVTLATGLVLILLTGLSLAILAWLTLTTIQRNQDVRRGFLDRDLREITLRLDAEERQTFERNVDRLIPNYRTVSPLLLPRQYYVALPPPNIRSTPRLPPRNCFLNLETAEKADSPFPTTRVCPYFAENKSLGRYLFLSATISDDSLVPLRPGDVNINADALKITVRYKSKVATWWLTYQTTPATTRGRYEITAIRENADHTRERDRRVEGWAYTQNQADGSQIVNLVVRIDFKEFLTSSDTEEDIWPPQDWEKIQLSLARKDLAANGSQAKTVTYNSLAKTALSGFELAEAFIKSHTELVVVTDDIPPSIHRIYSPSEADGIALDPFGYVSIVDGDLLVKGRQLTRTHILPDTKLTLKAIHSANTVNAGVWQAISVLIVLSIGSLVFAPYLLKNLLIPIFTLTRQSRRLLHNSSNIDNFSYGEKVSEIGILARSLNELLDETRRQAQREASRKFDEIRIREDNLRVLGHEIRAPLQALLSLHPEGTTTHPYLKRMRAALPHLHDGVEAQEAFGNRELVLEETDIAIVASDFAASAHLLEIQDVTYSGPTDGVSCWVDFEAIEDVFSHIIKNAADYRSEKTPIQISIEVVGEHAILIFKNIGPRIPSEHIESIFEFGFSTKEKKKDAGAGIGLYVARVYVSKMNGDIRAENLEHGVQFQIRLPLVT